MEMEEEGSGEEVGGGNGRKGLRGEDGGGRAGRGCGWDVIYIDEFYKKIQTE